MFTEKTNSTDFTPSMGVICSGPPSIIKEAIQLLRQKKPGCVITALASEGSLGNVSACSPDKVLATHKSGRFSLFKTGIKKVKIIRREGFGEVILLYNNPLGRDCLNLDLLGLFLGGKVLIFDSKQRFYPLWGKRWMFYVLPLRFFGSLFSLLLCAIVSPLVLILYSLAKVLNKKSVSTEHLNRYGG